MNATPISVNLMAVEDAINPPTPVTNTREPSMDMIFPFSSFLKDLRGISGECIPGSSSIGSSSSGISGSVSGCSGGGGSS